MTYSGNSSLSQDMRERIESTYRQTLELAAQGNRQEASLGCDFILRLDPDFTPAQRLLDRLEDGEGPVNVADLRSFDGPGAAAAGPDTAGAAEGDPLAGEIRRLAEERRFADALEHAAAHRDRVMADPELQRLVAGIQERHEAAPFIASFLDKARADLRSGDADSAARHLANARELDPGHPDVRDFETLLGASAPAAAPGDDPLGDDPFGSLDDPLLDLDAPSLSLDPPTADPAPTASEEPARADDPEATNALSGLTLEDLGIAATVPPTGGEEGDDRIRELLVEGQAAFDDSRYQDAIDAWSRIFLIDIDHREAAQRIEEARKLKAEREREVEDVFHEGVEALESGDKTTARARFERVIKLQPNHLAAREYLTQIEENRVPTAPAAGAAGAAGLGAAARSTTTAGGLGDLPGVAGSEELSQEILVPPAPGETPEPAAEAPRPAGRTAVASASRLPSRKFLIIGGAVLVLVLLAAFLLFSNRDRFFGNTDEPSATAQADNDPIQRAMRLYEQGNVDNAVTLLERVPPGTPYYDEAQARLSQWRAAGAGDEAQDDPELDPALADPGPSRAERRATLVTQAQEAVERGDNLYGAGLLERAGKLSPLGDDEQALLERARVATQPLDRQIALIRGGDWELAAGELWRLHEEDRSNRDVRRLLADAYHNLGVRELQRGNTAAAAGRFDELVGLEPNNAQAKRQLALARTYQERPKDLLFEIYARKLSFRSP